MNIHWKTALFIACLVIATGCVKKVKKPADVLTKKEMVKVLMEVYLVEAKINRQGLSSDSSGKMFDIFYDKLLTKSAVSDSVFQKSFNFYRRHPKELELIYTAVVDSLNLREQRASFSH